MKSLGEQHILELLEALVRPLAFEILRSSHLKELLVIVAYHCVNAHLQVIDAESTSEAVL